MCAPACNSCSSEQRSVKLAGNIKHTVKQTTVKIDIGRNALIDFTLFADNLRGKSFNSLIKSEIFIVALSMSKLFNCALENYLTRVGNSVNCVTHTVDKSHSVKCLLFKDFFKIICDFLFVCPIFYICLDVLKHIENLNICTAVLRSFKRCQSGCSSRIGIRTRGGYNMGCKG